MVICVERKSVKHSMYMVHFIVSYYFASFVIAKLFVLPYNLYSAMSHGELNALKLLLKYKLWSEAISLVQKHADNTQTHSELFHVLLTSLLQVQILRNKFWGGVEEWHIFVWGGGVRVNIKAVLGIRIPNWNCYLILGSIFRFELPVNNLLSVWLN